MGSERRLGALLVAGGCLPFAAGALMDGDGPGLPCPFRDVTGVPCPLCGASRAFALAARGDGDLYRYNAAWVALAAAAVLAGLIALAASAFGRAPLTRARAALGAPPRLAVALALLVALPWAYAITERQAILGT
jgi:Protein of unknown function (DUF2752)